MKVSTKKVAQAATAALLVTCYTTLVVILQHQQTSENGGQNGVHIKTAGHASRFVQERSLPRAILSENAVDYDRSADFAVTPMPLDLGRNYTNNLVNNARTTDLEDVFISVKTTNSFHQSRLDVILKTWFVLARDQTFFFTDAADPVYQAKTNGHLFNTNCSSSHNRKALCCKMAVEFDTFLESKKRWFCHFDDDNYVNVPRLVKLLQRYNHQEPWYLGKPSIRAPLEIFSRDNPKQKISFWFATGGAGFCLSRALALKMMPIASGGKFISIGEKIRLPDDVTMGYIIEHLLKQKLTVVEEFHSHLELMKFLKVDAYADQITFSYSRFGREMNSLAIDGFDTRADPTRFLSLHCHLFPNFSFCPR